MQLTIYTEVLAKDVEPLQWVATDRGPIEVDEVRKAYDPEQARMMVSVLGLRVGTNSSRREHLRFEVADRVRVVPDRSGELAVWRQLVRAMNEAKRAWLDEDNDTRYADEAPWDATHTGELVVRVDGVAFRVAEHVSPEPEPDDGGPEPDPAADTAREADEPEAPTE